MSFLNWPTEDGIPSRRAQVHRRAVVLDLFDRFHREFPEITYELLWESPTVNAQAWRLGSARYVRVYGGLVRHPAIKKFGLSLMLAHETGHHLGGAPRDPAIPWMSWQGQADYWAASVGMPKIWGARARAATLRAARELVELHRMFESQLDDDEPDLPVNCRYWIWRAAALGQPMPSCALEALASISDDVLNTKIDFYEKRNGGDNGCVDSNQGHAATCEALQQSVRSAKRSAGVDE